MRTGKTRMPRRLSPKMEALLILAVKQHGSYNPDQILVGVEESFTLAEARQAQAFLAWVHAKGRPFGTGTIHARYRDFLAEIGG